VVTTQALNNAEGDSFPALKQRVRQNVHSFLSNAYIGGAIPLFPHTSSRFGTNLSTRTILYSLLILILCILIGTNSMLNL